MNRPLSLLVLPLVFAAGCAHTPAATLPTLPASHGQLTLSFSRHLKLPVAPPLAQPPTDGPKVVVTAEEAPTVFAQTVQLLRGQPTPVQTEEASEDLDAACSAGLDAACAFTKEQFKGPEWISGEPASYPPLAVQHKAFGVVLLACRMSVEGRVHSCDVLERAPYGFTEDMLQAVQKMRYRPATLAGHPIEISYTFHIRMTPYKAVLTAEDELRWAQRRVAAFPRSTYAWFALAEQLSKPLPADPNYVPVLEQLHELAPRFWWSANELAWAHVQAGEYEQARALLVHARKDAESHPYVLETLAATAFGLGECARAVADQRTAMGQLPAEWPGPERERFQRQLEAYTQKCAPSPAP